MGSRASKTRYLAVYCAMVVRFELHNLIPYISQG